MNVPNHLNILVVKKEKKSNIFFGQSSRTSAEKVWLKFKTGKIPSFTSEYLKTTFFTLFTVHENSGHGG